MGLFNTILTKLGISKEETPAAAPAAASGSPTFETSASTSTPCSRSSGISAMAPPTRITRSLIGGRPGLGAVTGSKAGLPKKKEI